MRRTNQGGSVASFIIVGIILVAVISSLVYFVAQRGRQARIDQATTIAVQQAKDTKTAEQASPTDTGTGTTTPPKSDGASTEVASSEVSSDLPHTGPHFEVSEMVGSAFLTIVGVSFVMSRRAARRFL